MSFQVRGKSPLVPANQSLCGQSLLQRRNGSGLLAHRPRQRLPASQEGRHHKWSGITKPISLRTNEYGFFDWRNWDGRPWEAVELWAYHGSKHFYLQKRTTIGLRQARTDAKKCAGVKKSIWHNYYAHTQFLNNRLHCFQLFLIDSQAIATLLHTTPRQIRRRLALPALHLDGTARNLQGLLTELHELQRPRLNQIPLSYHPLETRVNIDLHTLEQIELICDASLPLWAVEPMIVLLALATRRLSGAFDSFPAFTRIKGHIFPKDYIRRSRKIQRAIQYSIWDLSELGHELRALRYYRLSKCPTSMSSTSIKVGKQLWQRLRSLQQGDVALTEAPNASSFISSPTGWIMWTNARGLLKFRRWTGEDWDVERLQHYKSALSVTAAASAEAEYQAVAMRSRYDVPSPIRNYLLTYYNAVKEANERMHPYVRYHANLSVIGFLLRTAPFRFPTRFDQALKALDILDYDMMLELEALRNFHIMLACLPSSPLLFQGLAKRAIASRTILQSGKSRKSDGKLLRVHFKAEVRSDWESLHQEEYLMESQNLLKLMRPKYRPSDNWARQYPCVVAEPLYNAVSRVLRLYKQLRTPLQNVRNIVIAFSDGSRWRQIDNVSELLRKTVSEIIRLTHYFTAMRYYRAQHFPGSISAGEMFVPDSLLAIGSTRPLANNRRAVLGLNSGQTILTKTEFTGSASNVDGERICAKQRHLEGHDNMEIDIEDDTPESQEGITARKDRQSTAADPETANNDSPKTLTLEDWWKLRRAAFAQNRANRKRRKIARKSATKEITALPNSRP